MKTEVIYNGKQAHCVKCKEKGVYKKDPNPSYKGQCVSQQMNERFRTVHFRPPYPAGRARWRRLFQREVQINSTSSPCSFERRRHPHQQRLDCFDVLYYRFLKRCQDQFQMLDAGPPHLLMVKALNPGRRRAVTITIKFPSHPLLLVLDDTVQDGLK